jgi:hypothetical protein
MIVTIIYNRKFHEFTVESPETTKISDIKELLSSSLLNCNSNNILLVYKDTDQDNNIYLSDYSLNNITFNAVIIPVVCNIHQSSGEETI